MWDVTSGISQIAGATVGTSDPLFDGFLWHSLLSPVILQTAHTYVIGGSGQPRVKSKVFVSG
jgi:hypothetical protein